MFLISVGRPAVRFSRSAEGGAARCRAAPVSPDFGGNSERETPLPIPNRAVKPLSADGTWPARAWESRSPPVLPDDEPPLGAAFRVLRPRLAGVEGRFTPSRRG